MSLLPCVHCQRHVDDAADACPFCGRELPSRNAGRRPEVPRGLSRAAILALGTAVATASAVHGCSDETEDQGSEGAGGDGAAAGAGDQGGGDQGGGGGSGIGGMAQPYGAPPQADD